MTEIVISVEQKQKVRHSIGFDCGNTIMVGGKSASNRAHYIVASKKIDSDWEKLVKKGLATSRVLHDMRIYHPSRALAESVLNDGEILLSSFWDKI